MLEEKGGAGTPISEFGEFMLIDHLMTNYRIVNSSTIKGVGDDAAVIERNDDSYGLLSTDLLIEGVHFDLGYTPLKHLGYKAVVSNISDMCAMNGVANQVVVGIALSSRFPVEAIEELYNGIRLACERYNVDLVGGDTTSSKSGLMLSIAVYGSVNKNSIAYRSGANENDLIVVSGDLGAAYMGLQVLEREKSVYKSNPNIQPDLSGYDYILERQLKPEARVDIIQKLSEHGVIPTSMIDISDGLASELLHLSKSSGHSVQIYDDKIPIDPATITASEEFELNPVTCALNGGEDYELLFTVKQSDLEKVHSINGLTFIGHVTGKSEPLAQMVTSDSTVIRLQAQGWKHF